MLLTACAADAPGSASITPAREFNADDLPDILVSADNAPDGLTVEQGDSGQAALILPLAPGGDMIDDSAFVDALTTRIGHTMTGGYTSWSALFMTPEDARDAFEFIAAQHESEAGWALEPQDLDIELGADEVHYTGPYGPWDAAQLYFWREGNLLLAAIGVGDFQDDVLMSIAQGMDDRAE